MPYRFTGWQTTETVVNTVVASFTSALADTLSSLVSMAVNTG